MFTGIFQNDFPKIEQEQFYLWIELILNKFESCILYFDSNSLTISNAIINKTFVLYSYRDNIVGVINKTSKNKETNKFEENKNFICF